jgi:NAD-dependent deacetylase
MYPSDLQTRIAESSRVVGFTGAGISTESGISDYRGDGGVWTKYRVVALQEFLATDSARREYWERKTALWPSIRDAEPNAGHYAFAALHQQGRLAGLITQNIDDLHRKAGVPGDKIIELHGNTTRTACLQCKHTTPTQDGMDEFVRTGEPPTCAKCGGWMKPATISFGQSMPEAEVEAAVRLCGNADVFVAAGSSLAVQPAASLPVLAKQNGALLIIVNRNETALDGVADAVVRGETGAILPELFSVAPNTSDDRL